MNNLKPYHLKFFKNLLGNSSPNDINTADSNDIKLDDAHKNKLLSGIDKLPFVFKLMMAWLAGAVFMLSLAPHHLWPLALLSPAVLYALLRSKLSNKHAFFIGEMYGMGFWCVGAFWLYVSIHTYGDTPAALALLAIALMGLGMGLFHGLLAVLFNRYLNKQPLAFASIWVLFEWIKTWLFTGFPWLFVGYAFTEVAWISSLAPVFGVFAISFVAVLVASSLVEMMHRRLVYLVPSAIALAAAVALWLINPQWTKAKTEAPLKVSLIQGNIPQDLKWLLEYQQKTLEIYAELTSTELEQDLVIWPEASIPLLQTDAWPFISEVAQVAKQTDTTWVTGVPYKDDLAYQPAVHRYPPIYNAVIALGAEAEGIYKKQRLVPFGEYIPFEGLLDIFPNLDSGEMSFSRGADNQPPINVRGHNMGVAICYEVAYPETTRKNAKDTEFLLTISNDAWFEDSAGPLQHLQMVQMRSLETGRWFLRATNTGVTAIINEKGQIVKEAPQFERMVLRGEVESRTGETPFMQMGQVPVLLWSTLLLLFSLFNRLRVNRVKQ